MRIAINGMGRIGRLLFRRLIGHPDFEVVAVNDIMPPDNLAYLVKYDSVYGTFAQTVTYRDGSLQVDERAVAALQIQDPLSLPWKKMKVDVVLECAGKFSSYQAASGHLSSGATKVLLSTTGSVDIPLLIYGYNQDLVKADTHIISPGGCMTNCSVHILHLLSRFGIDSAQLNILHSYTSRQGLVDGPHRQFRRGRAASESIIPVEIDLHHSLERLIPELHNRIAAVSTRVPVANGAMADFSVMLEKNTTVEEINQIFKQAADGPLNGIVGYTEEPLVSLDIKGNTHSCLVDGTLTSIAGKHVKIIAWFDNEFGFTSRMIDWLYYWKSKFTE